MEITLLQRMTAKRATIAASRLVGERPEWAVRNRAEAKKYNDAALHLMAAMSPFSAMLRSVPRSDNRCEAVIRECFYVCPVMDGKDWILH